MRDLRGVRAVNAVLEEHNAGDLRIDVVIESATQSRNVTLDDEGWFVLTPIPTGALRVRLTTQTRVAITGWFHP